MTEYLGECSTSKNVVPDCLDEMEYEYDNFDGFEKRIEYSQTILKYSSHAQKNLFTTQYYSAFFIEVLKKKRLLSLAKMKKLLYEFWGKFFLKGSVESERVSSSTSTCQPFRGSVRLLTIFWWRKIYSWGCTSSRKTFATWSRREFKRMLSEKISQPVLRSVSADLILLRSCSKSKRKSCFGLWTLSTNLSIELWTLLTVILQNLWQTHTGWLELEAKAVRNRAR